VGTAIAFFVVMGDLGPPLLAEFTGIEQTANLRLVILTGTTSQVGGEGTKTRQKLGSFTLSLIM